VNTYTPAPSPAGIDPKDMVNWWHPKLEAGSIFGQICERFLVAVSVFQMCAFFPYSTNTFGWPSRMLLFFFPEISGEN